MANVNTTQGLQNALNLIIGATPATKLQALVFDDNTHTFLASDTACSSQGASPHSFAAAFDSLPSSATNATPSVGTMQASLPATSSYDGNIIKRASAHNSGTPTDSSNTLCHGQDGLSFTKVAGMKLSYQFQLQQS